MNHESLRELLGAFAIDAVDADEAAMVNAHLTTCPKCRDEVAQYRQTAAVLATSGGEAPVDIWDAIAARTDPPPAVASAFPGLEAPRRSAPRRPRRALVRGSAALMAAAAAAAIVVLGVQVSRLNHRVSQVTSSTSAQTLSAAARSALLDPSGRRVVFAGVTSGGGREAEIVALPSGTAFLFNEGLPALPAAKTYQLWAMIGAQPISLGLLGRHPETAALTLDVAPKAFAITVEPAGGSVAPTGPVVATTTL